MLGESLRVPFRPDDRIGTLLVGSVLTLLVGLLAAFWLVALVVSPAVAGLVVPLVALPSLVLRGYLLGVVRSGIRGEGTVDSFVQWGSLVRDGTRSALVSAIYLLPAAACLGVALGGGIATAVEPEGFVGPIRAITALVILFGGFGLLVSGLVYLYVRPAARAVFAATGSVRAALDVRRVLALSSTGDYITGWLIAMGILVVGPTLLGLPAVVSLAVAAVSPPLGAVGLLLTLLVGIGVGFVCRLLAAYASGLGSDAGLALLYPATHERLTEPTPSQAGPTPPLAASRPTEVSAAVQTGRTVQPGNHLPAPAAGVDSETTVEADPIVDSEAAPVAPVDDGQAAPGGDDQAAPDGEQDTPVDDEQDTSDGDGAFIWGPTDE